MIYLFVITLFYSLMFVFHMLTILANRNMTWPLGLLSLPWFDPDHPFMFYPACLYQIYFWTVYLDVV